MFHWYLAKPSWSTYSDLPKQNAFEHPRRKTGLYSLYLASGSYHFPGTHWGLGTKNWSFLKIEETSSWNHRWSLPGKNNGGSKTCESYYTRKHCIVKRVQSDGIRTVQPDMWPMDGCHSQQATYRNGESACWNVCIDLIQLMSVCGL